MPLPTNTTLSLLGYSRPGDPLQSKPKQAMLVRLSTETLNALSSPNGPIPALSVQLGDNPSLFIGDTVFPMRHTDETSIHEIFLRTSSASKKSAPLKLHANVVGKLTVERELVDEVRDKVRESTQDAAAQRNTRTTMFIDTPPDIPNARKRKDPPSNMFHKPTRPSGALKATPIASTSSLSSSVNKPVASASVPRTLSSPARLRIIQHLALTGEATESRLFQMLGESDRTSTTPRQFQDQLSQIAELTSNKSATTSNSPRSYRLKPETWKEVRPYEWGILNEQEQTKIARSARNVFQSLRIPESDPLWQHVIFRNPASTTQSQDVSRVSSTSSAEDKTRSKVQEPVKRGITSKTAKEKISKPKVDTKGEIMAKDESVKVPARVTQQTEKIRRTVESPRPDPSHRATQQTEKSVRKAAESPRPDPPSRSVLQADKPIRRTAESPRPDARSLQQPEKPVRRTAESPRPADVVSSKSNVTHISKAAARPSTSHVDRERDREPPRAAPPKNKAVASSARAMERVPSTASSNARSTPVPDTANSVLKSRKAHGEDDRATSPEREKRPRNGRPTVNGNNGRDREKEKERGRERGMDRDRDTLGDEARPVKRKVDNKIDDDYYQPPSQKRRKSERQPSPSISSAKDDRDRGREDREREHRGREDRGREDRGRDISSARRSNVDPSSSERPIQKKPSGQSTSMKPPKRKNESPPPPIKRPSSSTMRERMPSESGASSRSQTSHATERSSHTSKTSAPPAKPRRRSPIYTSSEEEEEPPRVSTSSNKASGVSSTVPSHARNNTNTSSARPLPTDHAALRALYDQYYIEYLGSYHRLAMYRGKINKLLKRDDLVNSGFVTDSDGDDLEELSKLTKEHRRLEGELKSIREAFGQNMDGDLSPDSLTP